LTQINEDYRYTINKHVAITAGAGSGKTYTLSRRYINGLLGFDFFTLTKKPVFPKSIKEAKEKSATPQEIVTTTFTEAGAMEMRSRIEELISIMIQIIDNPNVTFEKQKDKEEISARLCSLNPKQKTYVREKLQSSLETIHLSIISTIHKFALSIIKQNVELVPMDTSIDIIDESSMDDIFNSVWFTVINSNQQDYLDIANEYSKYNSHEFAKKYTFDSRIRDGFDSFIKEINNNTTLKKAYLKLFFEKNIDELIAVFKKYESCDKSKFEDNKIVYTQPLKTFLESIFELEVQELPVLKYHGNSQLFTGLRNLFKNNFIKYDYLEENNFQTLIIKLHDILKQTRQGYLQRIENEGKLDFDRILEAANKLVNNKAANLKTYKYFFVDEFQDTNYLQWSLIKTSANLDQDNSANIFLVGDEKQSIFEFQGAEVSTFQTAIKEIINQKGKNSIVTPSMVVNYRSDQDIISFVNGIFQNMMTKNDNFTSKPIFETKSIQNFIDKVYDEYLSDINNDHEVAYKDLSSNSKNTGTVKILVKETPQLEDDGKLEGYKVDSVALHEANMIAYFINEIKNNKYPEYEDIYKKIKNNQKAIAILCDAKKNMLIIKKALKKYGLESKVSASENYYATQEIVDIFYVLAMCEYLKDDSNLKIFKDEKNGTKSQKELEKQNILAKQKRFFLLGALRSSVFKYSDIKIKEIISTNTLPDEVKQLISLSGIVSLVDLINYIVENYEVKRVFAHQEDYAQKKSNIKKLIQMASDFKPLIYTPLKEFVEMLEGRILSDDSNNEEQAFYESTQTNIIDIRTMHSSKGLSWPMVIVPELGRSLQGKTQTLNYATYMKNDKRLELVGFSIEGKTNISNEIAKFISQKKKFAEKKRLLYVSMTRPENHLVITLAKQDKERIDSKSYWARWLGELNITFNKDNTEITVNENNFLDSISKFKNSKNISIEHYNKTLILGEHAAANEEDIVEQKENLLLTKTINITKLEPTEVRSDIENIFESKKAAEFGTLAHLILELGYADKVFDTDEEENYIENFIKEHKISEEDRLKEAVYGFKKSEVYEELKNSEIIKFEQEFNFFDKKKNYNQKRIIDLLYYHDEKWNIIDFKSNSLKGRTKKDIIIKSNYTEQLQGYYDYVADSFGEDSINRCEILWLEDGTLSNMKETE